MIETARNKAVSQMMGYKEYISEEAFFFMMDYQN